MDPAAQLKALLEEHDPSCFEEASGTDAQLADLLAEEGHPELSPLAACGWLAASLNDHFDELEHGYGPYADLVAEIVDRAGGHLDETADYAMAHDGELGVLLGVSIDGEGRFFWKHTGYSRSRCHTNLVLLACRDAIERLGLSRRLLLLVENDRMVVFGVLPPEVADEAVQRNLLTPGAPRDDRIEPRCLEPDEVDDLPFRA